MKPMKEGLGPEAIKRISSALKAVDASLPIKKFQSFAAKNLGDLELRARVNHFITGLHRTLPTDFMATADILEQIPDYWDFGDPDDSHKAFAAWPVIDYVAAYGIDHPKRSLQLLATLTHLFSAEFAIRPFYIHHYRTTLAIAKTWTTSDSEHIRRLASEGCRPRLPWGQQLKTFINDPKPLYPILNALKDDPSLYVRKSVANNLNDISKDHPDWVIDIGQKWLGVDKPNPVPNRASNRPASNREKSNTHREWIIRHATRTLIKAGYPKAMTLQGCSSNPAIEITSCKLSKQRVKMGDDLTLTLTLQSQRKAPQKLIIDYAIHFLRANGDHSKKVFKLKTVETEGHEAMNLTKKHTFKEVTTRKHYPGKHYFELLINGKSYFHQSFILA